MTRQAQLPDGRRCPVPVNADMQITDLADDDHACLTFGEEEELFDLTAAYVRDGLAGGRKVVWVCDGPPEQAVSQLARRGIGTEQARTAGQMTAASSEGPLLLDQSFTSDRALAWLLGQVRGAQDEGYAGVRVALDMCWAMRPVTGIEELPEFEKSIPAVLAGLPASVLCQYDRERFDPVTLASVTGCHSRSVTAATYHAGALLRICRQYAPPGVRLAGELDYTAREPLALALSEAIRLDGDITINMAELTFIDAPSARMILDAARGLDTSRSVVLRCTAEIAGRMALYGVADVPVASVVTVHER